jgi:photosystem II stability/assembly factor-like uncharacterized protein
MGDVQVSRVGAWLGGTVVDIATCGDVAVAATFAGLFRSADGGHSWQSVGQNLPDWFIQAVALAPMGDQIVGLAASHTGWLYCSMDGGQTWETASYWLNLGIVTRLAASPNFEADGIVFACTEEDGIFKSSDRGRNWKQASFGLLNLNVASLCFSPDFARDEVVFAGTDGGGLFRSRNAGRAWRESGEGLPDTAVQCLSASPNFAQDGVVWAGTEDRGLYRSTDGGHTWSPAGDALSEACVNGLYVSPEWAAGGHLIAATDQGLLVSSDGGQQWETAQDGAEYPYVVARCGDDLLAGAYGDGIYRSTTGVSWQRSNHGLAAHVPPIACFSDAFEQDHTLLLGSMEGLLVRSADAGQTWRVLQEEDEFALSTLNGTGSGDSMTLLAAVEAGLLCSHDSGETWAGILDVEEDQVSAVALSSAGVPKPTIAVGTSGGRVLLSRDGGASWEQAPPLGESVVALAVSAGQDSPVPYVVTARQTAEGDWELTLRGGDRLTGQADEPVCQLYPFGPNKLLCALGPQVLYLEDGHLVSSVELQGEAPVSSLAVVGDVMFVGTRLGLYRSIDGAQTWHCLTADISALFLHAVSPEQLYVVSMGGQLWRVDLSPA